MIQKTQSFKTSDGQLHESIEKAQRHELILFLTEADIKPAGNSESLADALLAKKEHIVDLLRMKATSRPKARKINGGTKKRAVAQEVPK